MITSNINEILLKNEIANNNSNEKKTENEFLNNLIDSKYENTRNRTNSFTYENIKGISLEEIDNLFDNEEDRNKAKNLRLATLFTEDEYLGKSLFNTVLGKPYNIGLKSLYETYEDKHNFLESFSSSNSFSDIFHDSIKNRFNNIEESNSIEQVPQHYIDEILLKTKSYNFLTALSSNSNHQYNKYKDEDNKYAFLYNDYYLKYQELINEYEKLKVQNTNLINQF